MSKKRDDKVRPPVVQGIFYPEEREELEKMVHSYLADVPRGNSPLLYIPHAAFSAVGSLMGKAFSAAAARKITEIVILSPVHREEQNNIILPSFTHFEIASSTIPVNMKSLHLFKSDDKNIIRDNIPHLEEHAIEDQLPFINLLFPQASILPVLLGKTTINLVKKVSSGLKRAYSIDRNDILFIATGNLSSYGKKEDIHSSADKALKLFNKGDWKEICEEERTGGIEACGAGALSALLAYFNSPLKMKILDRTEPENRESTKGKTVAYGALAFDREE